LIAGGEKDIFSGERERRKEERLLVQGAALLID
jgi:hypothetical protein